MKILFYNHTGKVSGAERVLLMILGNLGRARHDGVLLCPPDGPLIQMADSYGVRTIAMDSLAARFTWHPDRLIRYLVSFGRMIRRARAVAVNEAPDIVHANSIRAGLVMSAATIGLGVRVVWHVHDLLPRHPFSSVIRLFTLASGCNHIVAVSAAVADRFRGGLLRLFRARVPIILIYNAVDVARFQPNAAQRQETRLALGFTEHQLIVGSVGQLTPRKAQRELIAAFAEVAEEIPHAVLLIAGAALFAHDFEYEESLKETSKALGISDRVHFLGQREDVADLMRAFDTLVVNSRAEPFGLTVVEGMAGGTTVLATAVDGIRETVEHDRNSWLVEPADHDALVAGLRKLLIDASLRKRLSASALTDAQTRFCADRFLGEIQNLYRGVLECGVAPHGEKLRDQVECGLKT